MKKVNPFYRFLVYLIDYLIFTGLIFLFIRDMMDNTFTAYKYTYVVLVIYQIIFLSSMNGQTLGKRIGKIRVVSMDRGALSFFQIIIREVSKLLYILPVVGILLIISNIILAFINDRRLLHDYLSGTQVIYSWIDWSVEHENLG